MKQTRLLSLAHFATMAAFSSLFASTASAAPAGSECVVARTGPSMAGVPLAWRAAVDELIRSTAEPGHPWSCAGGTIDLELVAKGALLRVAREGEGAVVRQVAVPEDVLPLGQALLATPLAPSPESGEQLQAAPPSDHVEPKPPPPLVGHEAAPVTTAAPVPATPSKTSRRLLLTGGVDGRYVGGSDVAWLGPTVSAGAVLGQWLPSLSLRQQSSLESHGPPIDEVSVAVVVQSRFEFSAFELRAGLALRGASVQRRINRRAEQNRLEARIGAVVSGAIPVLRWASVVISADADVVAATRESTGPESTGRGEPVPFPTYTIGGSACFEVSL